MIERMTQELKSLNMPNRVEAMDGIYKVISKEEARTKVEQSLTKLQKELSSFDVTFNHILEIGLPKSHGEDGEFLSRELYNKN